LKTPDAIKQKLGIEKGSGKAGDEFVGSISMNDVIEIARQLLEEKKTTSKTLKAAVKEVIGTCLSMGVLVDNKNPKEVTKEIEEGKYDNMLQ